MLLFVAHAFAAGLADCPRTFDTGEVVDAASSAEAAFMRVDAPGFSGGRAALAARLACSKDILSPAVIAQVHRVEALGTFLDQEGTRVPQALAGVFAAEPGHQIPSSLLPEGQPIRGLIPAAMLALRDDPGVALPKPGSGWIEVDGTHALRAPTQRSAVLQQIDGQGQVLATHYRWPDEAGFGWVVPVEASDDALATAAQVEPTGNRAGPWAHRAPTLAGAAASFVASGVLYAIASQGSAEFDAKPVLGPDASDQARADYRAELDGMQARTNGMTYGCYAAAGLGLAFGAVAVVTW
ncbi:MAG: hypothetical protein Q8P41_21385 [Pseudomonadota bacterium]|nr:hypothetical protein [Pseudomonadota bacterium]